jgi:hypothetical protein
LEQQHVPVRQPLLQQQSSSHPAGQQQPSLQQSQQDSAFAGARLPSRVNTVRKTDDNFIEGG